MKWLYSTMKNYTSCQNEWWYSSQSDFCVSWVFMISRTALIVIIFLTTQSIQNFKVFVPKLTKWTRVLLEKLPVVELLKNFSIFHWTRRLITMSQEPPGSPYPRPDESIPCISFFLCSGRSNSRTLRSISNWNIFLKMRSCYSTLHSQVWGPPLFGRRILLIQYINSYPHIRLLHPQLEDVPWRGGKGPI